MAHQEEIQHQIMKKMNLAILALSESRLIRELIVLGDMNSRGRRTNNEVGYDEANQNDNRERLIQCARVVC